jgi:hypothetical protein
MHLVTYFVAGLCILAWLNFYIEQWAQVDVQPGTAVVSGDTVTVYSYIGHRSLLRTANVWYDRKIEVYQSGKLVSSTTIEYRYPLSWEFWVTGPEFNTIEWRAASK